MITLFTFVSREESPGTAGQDAP